MPSRRQDSIDITDRFFRDILSDTFIEGGETIEGLGQIGGKGSVSTMDLGRKFFIGDASIITFWRDVYKHCFKRPMFINKHIKLFHTQE